MSFDAFRRYQLEQAWTWEHMALTRARPLFGSDKARKSIARIVGEELGRQRDPTALRQDVLEMRAEMARHKPPRGPLDAKLHRGGLVDLEFLVHYRQLSSGRGLVPALELALADLIAAGLVPEGLAAARETLARLLVAGRLLAPDCQAPPEAARQVLARACGFDDWPALLQGLAGAREAVAAAWAEVFGERLELG